MTFTGIVEELGSVKSARKSAGFCRFEFVSPKILEDLKIGDSVCSNGVCLTAAQIGPATWQADVMNETLKRTNFGALRPGSPVNFERAMPANGRFGGHIVSGHIDGTGRLESIRADGNAQVFSIWAPQSILHLIVEKGSIAIDGISLTVASLSANSFAISAIPHTLANTSLGTRKVGDLVNLENDLFAKYIERLAAK